jgi:CubicO group peptidase (beta-lactamase class C family)
VIIERATGKKLSAYLEEKLWRPLGMEHDATWNIDSKKTKRALASAGLNATARDFAKLGQLYLNKGTWNGQRIIDEDWVNSIASIDTMNRYGGYKNQWWGRTLYHTFDDSVEAASFMNKTVNTVSVHKIQGSYRVNYRTGAFSAIGFLNQYIYVNPKNQVVIVRIGKRWSDSYGYATQFIYKLGDQL